MANDAITNMANNVSSIMKTHNLPSSSNDIRYYDRFSRFGLIDPYGKFKYGKEYLFFTKPDLHIYKPNTTTLQPTFSNDPFFVDLHNRHPGVITQLQRSAGSTTATTEAARSPFMNLLSNSKLDSLELNGLSAGTMDGPANMWGGSSTYRKDSWIGDENVEFSLQFEDNKTLDIYYLLKAYENYHRYMMMGYIYPPNISNAATDDNGNYFDSYTANKELHTTFGIYKFIVDEDYGTLLYWAYVCGAYFVNVPRDAFSSIEGTTEGLKYSVEFKAFCVDDMNPTILANFNNYVLNAYTSGNYVECPLNRHVTSSGIVLDNMPSTNDISFYTTMNGEWPLFPLIKQVNRSTNSGLPNTMNYKYEMVWYKDK